MRLASEGWVKLKVWLCSPRLAIWGEGMVEGFVFSLIALGLWRGAWE